MAKHSSRKIVPMIQGTNCMEPFAKRFKDSKKPINFQKMSLKDTLNMISLTKGTTFNHNKERDFIYF